MGMESIFGSTAHVGRTIGQKRKQNGRRKDQIAGHSWRFHQPRRVLRFAGHCEHGLLEQLYPEFRRFILQSGKSVPKNEPAPGTQEPDKVLRKLDCAVINWSVVASGQGLPDGQRRLCGREPGVSRWRDHVEITHPDQCARLTLHHWFLPAESKHVLGGLNGEIRDEEMPSGETPKEERRSRGGLYPPYSLANFPSGV